MLQRIVESIIVSWPVVVQGNDEMMIERVVVMMKNGVAALD